ncbi:MAG: hypothetical protein COB83_12815 [Gammaproteobacteria bacterium]|nr:MAG: hypothetical protein COB83_12815 [Gammaproteobacteria bacterium]
MTTSIPTIPSFLDGNDIDSSLTSINENLSEEEINNTPFADNNIQKLIQHEFYKITLNLKKVLTFDECVEYTGLSKGYIYKLTHGRLIPHFKPSGKKIYFAREEIDQWLLSNRVMTTEEVQCQVSNKAERLNKDLKSHK